MIFYVDRTRRNIDIQFIKKIFAYSLVTLHKDKLTQECCVKIGVLLIISDFMIFHKITKLFSAVGPVDFGQNAQAPKILILRKSSWTISRRV